jgi:DnaJ-class molecular chaperone
MPFGKRPPPPTAEEKALAEQCPACRGAGAIRGRGQRKVCLTCKGTGKRVEAVCLEEAPSPLPAP